MTRRDVVIRDIKTTTVPQLRDVHIRDKIIKDCFFTRVDINSRDVFSKDRFMLAPSICIQYIEAKPRYKGTSDLL